MSLTHEEVTQNAMVDRYAAGALGGEDAFAFETHMVDCAVCQDELELCQNLKQGLRQTHAQPARPQSMPMLALAAALLLAVGVGWFSRPLASQSESVASTEGSPTWFLSTTRSGGATALEFPAGVSKGLLELDVEGGAYRLSIWDTQHQTVRYTREGLVKDNRIRHLLPIDAVPTGQWIVDVETAETADGPFELYGRHLVEIKH